MKKLSQNVLGWHCTGDLMHEEAIVWGETICENVVVAKSK